MEQDSLAFRQSRSLTDLRTPIVDNLMQFLPVGHEKAVKSAFYNTIALLLAAGVIVAFWGVYCILENFIRPLMWAALCGSVLHPFKENLCSVTRTWLRNAKKSSVPFTFEVMIVPLKITDSISDRIGTFFWKSWKSILMGIAAFFVTYVLYYNPPVTLVAVIQYIASTSFTIILWILSWINGPIVLALNVGYVTAILHYMSSRHGHQATNNDSQIDGQNEAATQPTNQVPESRKYNIQILSYASWSFTFVYICLRLPYPFLFALAIFLATGTVAYIRSQREKSFKYTLPRISRIACMMVLNIGHEASEKRSKSTSHIMSPIANLLKRVQESPKSPEEFTPSKSSPQGRVPRTASKEDKLPLHRSFSDSSAISNPQSGTSRTDVGNLSNVDPSALDYEGTIEMPSPIFHPSSLIEDEVDGHGIDSNKFLYGVFCACLVVFVWSRLWLMHLIPIPIVYYGIKKFGSRVGVLKYLDEKVTQPIRNFYFGADDDDSMLFVPEPVRVIFRIAYAGDRKIISFCEAYVDPVVSILVLVLVVMATILGLLFAATQVYAEGDHLVRVAGNLINRTVSEHPEINQMLPEGWNSVMNSMVDNAYVSGREYITNMVRDSISEADPKKAEQIERQVIELWDRLYLAWNQTWENAFTNVTTNHIEKDGSTEHHGIEWNELLQTGNLVELSVLANYAKANLGTLFSVVDSLWKILLGNISLAISAITSILSLLFGGGTAILNLIINMVVFFTALFYLLSSSTSVYKPVEIFNQWSPGSGVHSNRFAIAVEEAINGVFVASFKMALFYGLWTWLVHKIFQVNIVFVPSLLGGMFAAVPFLMPYWAAVPAVLELWLIQGHWPKALCMMLAQMAPMSAVDTQIYSEIKGGGHPYLTGLAVAGGIFYFGFQGAIIGPILLCLVFVTPDLIKVGNSYMWESSPVADIMIQRPMSRRPRDFGDTTDEVKQSSPRP